MPDQEPEEPSAQVRLWNAMKAVRVLALELDDVDIILASQQLENAYRRLYGDTWPT